jgi:hypothetical protein
MPKIEWKSAAIGAAAVYGFLWWQAKKAKSSATSTT